MGTQDRIEYLLKRFIQNKCTSEETEEIIQFFRKNDIDGKLPSGNELYSYMDQYFPIEKSKSDEIYQEILNVKQRKTQRKLSIFSIQKIAAVAVLLISLTILFVKNNSFQSGSSAKSLETLINVDNITLEIEDGTFSILDSLKQGQIVNHQGQAIGTVQNNKLVYDNNIIADSLFYNTLRVPYGRKYELNLADGTIVYLNSGSTLKYPVNFRSEDSREVFLNGEAYFEVAHQKENPFIVHTDGLDVHVLGTHFNVTAYAENTQTDVVLVEGSVNLIEENIKLDSPSELLLIPGEIGSFNKTSNKITSKPTVTSLYTSWINGELIFRNLTLHEMLKKLERHYNIPIITNENMHDTETFSANFGKEPIDKVFTYLKELYDLDYTIDHNKIIIN